ncbi:MAG: EamA family transporter [Firmicutes bacterium]|jgi:drug/metabolite transporter (DMT)-like permease|nr:EamA family transporter [Bacillota bacterium]
MKKNLGALITILAGILWGFSGACGQYIFERFPIEPAHLTSIRMLSAGIILCCIGFITDKKNMLGIWKVKTDYIKLIIFAVFGIMASQLTYMTAISYTNSGTATILQYIGPVLVMIASCVMQKRLPTARESFAIFLVIIGTFFIATHGNISNMIINTSGLIWGLLAAVALALYTLIPGNITKQYSSVTITGYGMLLGGIVLAVLSQAWKVQLSSDFRFIAAFAGIVIFGTVLTFTLYLKGITMVGPVTASMLASVEPVSAAAFMIVWLKVPFHYMDLIGFSCILITIFLLTKKERPIE